MSTVTTRYNKEDLRFDGPIPEDHGWPFKLKIALSAVVISTVSLFAAWIGAWVYFQINPNAVNNYGPLTYVVPVSIVNSEGEAPRVTDGTLPAPSFDEPKVIPVILSRTMDCVAHNCPDGGIEVSVTVRAIEIDTKGTAIRVYPIAEDQKFNFQEGIDYIPGQIRTNTLFRESFEFPEEALADMREQGKDVSAWRLEGTTVPVRSDAIPASWSSQVFHIRVDTTGE